LPIYTNIDISLSYDIKKIWKCKTSLGFVVQNIFNMHNIISKYYSWNYSNLVDGKPQLQMKDQESLGRMFNLFINIDL